MDRVCVSEREDIEQGVKRGGGRPRLRLPGLMGRSPMMAISACTCSGSVSRSGGTRFCSPGASSCTWHVAGLRAYIRMAPSDPAATSGEAHTSAHNILEKKLLMGVLDSVLT